MCETAFIVRLIHYIFCIFAENVNICVISELIYCWLLLFAKNYYHYISDISTLVEKLTIKV